MKRQKGSEFIFLLIVSVVLAASWVGFSLYRILTRQPAPSGVEEVLTPLNPTLKLEILDKLDQKTI